MYFVSLPWFLDFRGSNHCWQITIKGLYLFTQIQSLLDEISLQTTDGKLIVKSLISWSPTVWEHTLNRMIYYVANWWRSVTRTRSKSVQSDEYEWPLPTVDCGTGPHTSNDRFRPHGVCGMLNISNSAVTTKFNSRKFSANDGFLTTDFLIFGRTTQQQLNKGIFFDNRLNSTGDS